MISASCLKAFYCSLCFSESPSVCHQHQHGPGKEGQSRARRMDTLKLEHCTRSRSVNLWWRRAWDGPPSRSRADRFWCGDCLLQPQQHSIQDQAWEGSLLIISSASVTRLYQSLWPISCRRPGHREWLGLTPKSLTMLFLSFCDKTHRLASPHCRPSPKCITASAHDRTLVSSCRKCELRTLIKVGFLSLAASKGSSDKLSITLYWPQLDAPYQTEQFFPRKLVSGVNFPCNQMGTGGHFSIESKQFHSVPLKNFVPLSTDLAKRTLRDDIIRL